MRKRARRVRARPLVVIMPSPHDRFHGSEGQGRRTALPLFSRRSQSIRSEISQSRWRIPPFRVTGSLNRTKPRRNDYSIGNDSSKWLTDIPTYSMARYRSIYPGVNLVYYGNRSQFGYDFILAPAADAALINLSFEGVREVGIDDRGDLVPHTPGGIVRQRKPFVYQEAGKAAMNRGSNCRRRPEQMPPSKKDGGIVCSSVASTPLFAAPPPCLSRSYRHRWQA